MKANRGLDFIAWIAATSLGMVGAGPAWSGTEGAAATYYGVSAGASASAVSGQNTFIGLSAGTATTSGISNTFLGSAAGIENVTGNSNTFLGRLTGSENVAGSSNTYVGGFAGLGATGSRNVFLGFGAGASEAGSDKLVIDNCAYSGAGTCDRPFIAGNFAARLLEIDGVVGITAGRYSGAVESQLHFSVTGEDVGGWMTSAADNNFFVSSGARYDASAGGWIQRSPDGKAVMSGSGAAGFRVLTSSGGAVGSVISPVDRLHIDYNGAMGVNTAPAAGRAINTSTGAYLSSGGVWTNASSRALKEDIEALDAGEAMRAFEQLDPVRFRYRDEEGTHVGFIAEDVPALVATADRKGLSAMDVVAVLTKVLQQKSQALDSQQREMARMNERLQRLEAALARQAR